MAANRYGFVHELLKIEEEKQKLVVSLKRNKMFKENHVEIEWIKKTKYEMNKMFIDTN